MNIQTVSRDYDHLSPAGAEIRLLMHSLSADLVHCTLKKGAISKGVTHKTVSEFWYILSGTGALWRKDHHAEYFNQLRAGIVVDIPIGVQFQYRCDPDEDLVFLCYTDPPWPGPEESSYIASPPWTSNVE